MLAVSNDQYPYNPKVIETLTAHGAYVDIGDICEKTILHYACEKCIDCSTISMLLQAGAYVNAADDDGRTPLMMAAGSKGKFAAEIVNILLKSGANVNAVDCHNQTALDLAADDEIRKILKELM